MSHVAQAGPGPDPPAELDLVIARTCELKFRIWGFGEGPALLGLLACTSAGHKAQARDLVVRTVEPFLRRSPTLEDHVACAEVLLALEACTSEPRWREAAAGWAQLVLNAPRPVARRPPAYRPDLFGLSSVAWVDTLHTHGPGLAALGFVDEAVELVEQSCRALQDKTGLFYHGYDIVEGVTNGVHWGRGCGWALLGLIGTRAYHEDAGLAARTQELVTALCHYEEDGRWHTIVDDGTSPFENSVSALVAASLMEGAALGLVGPELEGVTRRAFLAAMAAVTNGALPVSEATPVGDRRTYMERRTGVFAWGQGPLLMAMARDLRPETDESPTRA